MSGAIHRKETGLQELRRKIEAQGTHVAFAEAIGISKEHLSLVLKGERGLSTSAAIKISQAVDMPIERFAGSDARCERPARAKKLAGRR